MGGGQCQSNYFEVFPVTLVYKLTQFFLLFPKPLTGSLIHRLLSN